MHATTKQFRKRNAILACLRQTCDHPSAEMVYLRLHAEHPDISLATVYRNLALFRSQGVIQSLGSFQGVERFDACTHPHAHLICTDCGAVADLPQVEMPYEQGRKACAESGFVIQDCQLTFIGLCETCHARNSRESDL